MTSISNFKILGIDPGTTDCGICLLECDSETLDIVSIDSRTILSDKIYLPYEEDLLLSHTERYIKIKKIQRAFKRVLEEFIPHHIACESPFYHRLHPGAYAPLVEILFTLRDACVDFNKLLPFYLYEPTLIKKTMTGKAFADKDMMRFALETNESITTFLKQDVNNLSEHAVDAIAIAYIHLETLRNKR